VPSFSGTATHLNGGESQMTLFPGARFAALMKCASLSCIALSRYKVGLIIPLPYAKTVPLTGTTCLSFYLLNHTISRQIQIAMELKATAQTL